MRHLHLLLWLTLLCACSDDRQQVMLKGTAMGTRWSIQCDALPGGTTEDALHARLQKQLEAWEAILSHWQPASAVSRFNTSASTEWFDVPAELVEVVELSALIGNETDHALDITIAPLVDVWGFGATERRKSPPTETEIAAARAFCGWQHLQFRHAPPALRKTIPELRINVSAVAEGWAMERLARQLESLGLTRFLIEIGGEILARGEWRAGIQAPEAPSGEIVQSLLLKDRCLATSGVYRQRVISGDDAFSHVLDPRTGRPVGNKLLSVSVVHPNAALADGYATALLVLGPEAGREKARQLGIQAIWLEKRP